MTHLLEISKVDWRIPVSSPSSSMGPKANLTTTCLIENTYSVTQETAFFKYVLSEEISLLQVQLKQVTELV